VFSFENLIQRNRLLIASAKDACNNTRALRAMITGERDAWPANARPRSPARDHDGV
jgi:hypothetical protein